MIQKTLDWATTKECPAIFNDYLATILVDALGINGDANFFGKCQTGGYNLSWILSNGNEYAKTFSEEELLAALKNKVVNYDLRVRDAQAMRL